MRKYHLALALAAAFATAPAFGQATVDQKLQILQQEIDDLKAQARRAAPPTQQPAAPYAQDYGSPLGRSLSLGSGGTNITGYGEMAYSRSEEHTSELQSLTNLVCRLLL